MDFFQCFLSKMGCSLRSRVLLSRGLVCEGWLILVLILSTFKFFHETIQNMILYVVMGILFFVCYLILMFGIFHFKDFLWSLHIFFNNEGLSFWFMLFKQVGDIGLRVFSSSSRSKLGNHSCDWALWHRNIFFNTRSRSAIARDQRGLS